MSASPSPQAPPDTAAVRPAPNRFVAAVLGLSGAVLAVERRVLAVLMTLLLALILVNVATRYLGVPIYWVDEASVYTVVWLTFVGASIMTRLRLDFSVTLISDWCGEKVRRRMRLFSSLAVLFFGVALVAMCFLWMDPIGIARMGFDARAYAAESFNFLYTERTQTLEWPVWIIQLTIPLFALGMSLHALANICEDLDLAAPRAFPEFQLASADNVN